MGRPSAAIGQPKAPWSTGRATALPRRVDFRTEMAHDPSNCADRKAGHAAAVFTAIARNLVPSANFTKQQDPDNVKNELADVGHEDHQTHQRNARPSRGNLLVQLGHRATRATNRIPARAATIATTA